MQESRMRMATGSTRSYSPCIHRCYFNRGFRRLERGQVETPEGLAVFAFARALKAERFIMTLDHAVLRPGNIMAQKCRLSFLCGDHSDVFEQRAFNLTPQDKATQQPGVDVPV